MTTVSILNLCNITKHNLLLCDEGKYLGMRHRTELPNPCSTRNKIFISVTLEISYLQVLNQQTVSTLKIHSNPYGNW